MAIRNGKLFVGPFPWLVFSSTERNGKRDRIFVIGSPGQADGEPLFVNARFSVSFGQELMRSVTVLGQKFEYTELKRHLS